MAIVPPPHWRVPHEEPDVCPATPFGPGKEWPTTPEITHGVGEVKDITPDYVFEKFEPRVHLHPGPLGFVDVTGRFGHVTE